MQFPFNRSRYQVIQIIFRLITGDYSGYFTDSESTNPNLSFLIWLLFLISTFFIAIVLMNLLIAILGDTYGTVVGSENLANNYEKALLIVDYENMLSKQEKDDLAEKDFKGYLFYSDIPDENFDESERMRDKVENLEENIREFEEKAEENLDEAREDIKENLLFLKKEQNQLKSEINEYKNELSSEYLAQVLSKMKAYLEQSKKELEI